MFMRPKADGNKIHTSGATCLPFAKRKFLHIPDKIVVIEIFLAHRKMTVCRHSRFGFLS